MTIISRDHFGLLQYKHIVEVMSVMRSLWGGVHRLRGMEEG